MRERLPELLHDRLPADARAELLRHLELCADCRAELEILRHVRAISRTPQVDVARIVSALPSYASVGSTRRGFRAYAWRAAAAVLLLAGGAAIAVSVARRVDRSSAPPAVAEVPAPTPPVVAARVPARAPDSVTRHNATVATPKANELGVGEGLHDLTDSELRSLLADLENLEAVTPTETEVVPPGVERRGS
jgi:hypothetical protein